MMPRPDATIVISKPNLLVVEGVEERVFFNALIGHLRLQNVQVLPIGGKTKLRDELGALVISPSFASVVSLGVVRDADDDPDGAFQSVRGALTSVGLPSPERPLTPVGTAPEVTVVILPEPGKPGMLEDLCLQSVAQDPSMLCVEELFRCLPTQGLPLPRNMSKARIQVFLASREEPGKRVGEAAQAGYWPWDDKAFDHLKAFLRQIGEQEDGRALL
jgi:hypothetical protein